ncbi:THxN family PEP-CTERM protein [Thalassomonas viridans]|uniref:THxN family PEP-CTERM protein n=1 Tax=Thalassomonas viridans TaxID=137584 RepID=A0AAE9Z9E2_9GAMM|nr:THxN family PEP-CTERM protein [Thalassomonas viridans]WDE07517.1 THxN family PEP-CTERM protein [Thalassomonas viridans]
MNNHGFVKKVGLGVLFGAFSVNASAVFMTIDVGGGFNSFVEDPHGVSSTEYLQLVNPGAAHVEGVSPDVVVDTNQTTGVHDGLRWGGNGAYSSLVYETFDQEITALDTNYAISAITHNNFSISAAFSWLDKATIAGTLGFSSSHSGGLAAGIGSSNVIDDFTTDVTSEFHIDFKETYNQDDVSKCTAVSENSDGSGGDHVFASACDDYFDLAVDNQGSLPDTLPFSIPFYIDGKYYALEVFFAEDIDGMHRIDNDRVWTQEQQLSQFYTIVNLTEVEAPEPISLALMGVGLLGLGFNRRRLQLKK